MYNDCACSAGEGVSVCMYVCVCVAVWADCVYANGSVSNVCVACRCCKSVYVGVVSVCM